MCVRLVNVMVSSIARTFAPIIPVLEVMALAAVVLISLELIIWTIHLIWYGMHGVSNDDGWRRRPKHKSVLLDLFWYLPKQAAYDYLMMAPGYFKPQGIVIFCGRQGSGKTIAMTEYLLRLKYQYPMAKIMTNYGFTAEDTQLDDWHKLIDFKNGIYGVIAGMDELQNWFSSLASKDFPIGMMEVITQNRKNRRIILGTSQVFNRLAKPLREQATEVRDCVTFFGCLTVVFRKRPELDSEGQVMSWTRLGTYYFVHTKEIREAFDTYRIIETLSKKGFYQNPQLADSSVAASPAVALKKRVVRKRNI